eukprot:PLAT6663.2.p2 GENE.PLAT6663.2~~PLAT6663.2.p2  ORF type:complete len:425 (+),score=201.89 PLAT6663.2:49-1275(+)
MASLRKDGPLRRDAGWSGRVRFRLDMEKAVLVNNMERRGWVRAVDADEWNVFWASVGSTKALFSPDSGIRLSEFQLVNHFPNHYELTRKDLMVKNLKRYRKDMDKEGSYAGQLDFIPVTYFLPADYSLFVEEFRRSPHTTWIMKPTARARGIGIFLINRLAQLKKWSNSRWASMSGKDPYVISRYIEDPLLIGGRKFDLRLYALVTSYRPLKVFIYRKGFARFCFERYSSDFTDLDNLYIHLTNVAVQKHNEEYNEKHGGKWSLKNLLLYMQGIYGREETDAMMKSIDDIIVHSLKAVQNVMINDKHCFECYGYDIIIDSDLKPWLVEVNASPALTATTHVDRVLKTSMIHDLFKVVCPTGVPDPASKGAVDGVDTGGFDLLYDEAAAMMEERLLKTPVPRSKRSLWR